MCVLKKTRKHARKGEGENPKWLQSWKRKNQTMARRKPKAGAKCKYDCRSYMGKAKTLMFTPVSVNGVKFSRCLVDTGSEVNLIPTRAITANGFSYSPGEISAIKGFNGHEGQIIGGLLAQVQLGPMIEPKQVCFWVSPDVQLPHYWTTNTLKECAECW